MLRGVTMNYEMLDKNKLNELEAYINSFEDKPSHLIMILHRAQGLFGYLPKELQIPSANTVLVKVNDKWIPSYDTEKDLVYAELV